MRAVCRLCLVALAGMLATELVSSGRLHAQDASPVATPGAVVEGCATTMDMGAATAAVGAGSDIDPVTLDLDVLYIDVLIPHHEMAVAMAGIAQARSTRPEVVSLAAGIVEAQSRELDQLRAWRAAWYPDVPALSETELFAGLETKASSPGRGGAPGLDDLTMAGMEAAMAELCEETDLFDLVFIDEMVEHHTGAVLLSELVAVEAVHPELKELAQSVVEVQGAEITTMLGWRDAWYGGYPADHHGGDEIGTPAT